MVMYEIFNSTTKQWQFTCLLYLFVFSCYKEFDLDNETFQTLWNEYQVKGGIHYDEFVAVLTKLQILKG